MVCVEDCCENVVLGVWSGLFQTAEQAARLDNFAQTGYADCEANGNHNGL